MGTTTRTLLLAALLGAAITGGIAMGGDAKAGHEGAAAPEFRLNDHTGKAVRGSDIAKSGAWTVLAFYPKAMTPG